MITPTSTSTPALLPHHTPPAHSSTSATSPHTHPAPQHPPILILIAGAPCSGKKTVLAALKEKLLTLSHKPLHIATLHQRDFHRPEEYAGGKPSGAEKEKEKDRDMECIEAYDLGLLIDVIRELSVRGAGGIRSPKWQWNAAAGAWGREWKVITLECGRSSSSSPSSSPSSSTTSPPSFIHPDVIIAQGPHLLCPRLLLALASIKIFVECDPDVRLARRVLRDSTGTNPPLPASSPDYRPPIPLDAIFDNHVRFSKPAAEGMIQPTKVLADIILPRGAEGPGVELIAHGVLDDLKMLAAAGAGGGSACKGSGGGGEGGKGGTAAGSQPITTTLAEADLAGVTSSLAYYETV